MILKLVTFSSLMGLATTSYAITISGTLEASDCALFSVP